MNGKRASQIEDTLCRYLGGELKVDVDDPEFGPGTNLFDLGFIDSLEFIRLTVYAETTYGIRFDPSELFTESLMSVGGMAATIAGKLGGAGAGQQEPRDA